MSRLFSILALAACVTMPRMGQAQTHRWTHQDDDSLISVETEGPVTFSDDYRAVVSMGRGAQLSIRRREGRVDERLSVSMVQGKVTYDYRRGGKKVAYEVARKDIGDLLLIVVRETGLDAPERVARLLEAGGPERVFDEVALISSGNASARYLGALLEQARLSRTHLERLAAVAVEKVPSSGDRARLLRVAVVQFLENPAAFGAWAKAVQTIPSSGDRARTLLHALESPLSPPLLALVFESARGIASSGDKARVLVAGVEQFEDDTAVWAAFFSAAGTIPSSGDLARVLVAALTQPAMSGASLVRLLETSEFIASSGDRARVLVQAAPLVSGETEEAAYLKAAEGISSGGDRSRALRALIQNSQ